MTQGYVIDLVREAILTIILCAAPILIVSVAIGLVVSILQTTTSIQEQTLTFVPKILAVMGAVVYFGYFIIDKLYDFAMNLFTSIPNLPN